MEDKGKDQEKANEKKWKNVKLKAVLFQCKSMINT